MVGVAGELAQEAGGVCVGGEISERDVRETGRGVPLGPLPSAELGSRITCRSTDYMQRGCHQP
jgi:hypothetical protein